MSSQAKEFIAKLLGIDVSKISLVAMLQHLESPEGYQLRFWPTGLFCIKGGITDGNKHFNFVQCEAFTPSSLTRTSDQDAAQFLENARLQTVNQTGPYQNITPKLGTRWLAINYMTNNNLPVNNVFTSYEYLMGCDGQWDGNKYSKGDILRSPQFFDANNQIEFTHVSHVRTLRL